MNYLPGVPKTLIAAITAITALALTAASCGNSAGGETAGNASSGSGGEGGIGLTAASVFSPTTAPPQTATSETAAESSWVSGRVTISGSSTVEPVSVRVAELFKEVAPDVVVTVDGPGTGDGFKLFCAGETDISGASRQIRDKEMTDCAEAGIDWIELRVAIDGIAVMANESNSAVECLNFQDLYAIVGPESVGFDNWSQAGDLAAQLGSSTSFPDMPLSISAPGTESGTYDSFIEIVLEDIGDSRAEAEMISEDEAATTRPDYRSAGDDNVIISGIQDSLGSFGWVGFAYAVNADGVKLLEVDGGDGCTAATPSTIASGEYPVSRSLYIYVNAEKAQQNPAVRAYVDFYMSDSGLLKAVDEVGYVQLTSYAIAETGANWTEMVVGS